MIKRPLALPAFAENSLALGFGPSSFFLSKDRSNRACYTRFGATPACPGRRTRKYFRKVRSANPVRGATRSFGWSWP